MYFVRVCEGFSWLRSGRALPLIPTMAAHSGGIWALRQFAAPSRPLLETSLPAASSAESPTKAKPFKKCHRVVAFGKRNMHIHTHIWCLNKYETVGQLVVILIKNTETNANVLSLLYLWDHIMEQDVILKPQLVILRLLSQRRSERD